MRGSNLMTDKRESDEPVRVELKFEDWYFVPNRTHTKTIEIDREDWDEMDADERRAYVEDERDAWLRDNFSLSYEVLGADSFDDVPAEA